MDAQAQAMNRLVGPRAPVVFLTHLPMIWDKANSQYHPKINLTPAHAFGELFFLTPKTNRPPDPDEALEALAKHLRYYTTQDSLLLAGPPWLMCWAAVIAARQTNGLLRLLIWHTPTQTQPGHYKLVQTDLYKSPPVQL